MNSSRKEYLDIFDSIDFQGIKDHPNILIAARFWEEDRYQAAKTCYKFMRYIDDYIDNHKAVNEIILPGERDEFTTGVNNWLRLMSIPGNGNSIHEELNEVIERFRLPLWPFETFARSMIYDINNDGFATMDSFIDYSQGASVAPASIFVHLAGLKKENGIFNAPAFDVKKTAAPCALFSYLVHIIRDFQKDQHNNLTYFANDLMVKNNLTRDDLKRFSGGCPVNEGFRSMIKEYHALAGEYRLRTSGIINQISPLLEPRYRLSLRIIFNLYQMVFEKIDLNNGTFMSSELDPLPAETRKRVYKTIMDFTS
jgi:phytoene/squalene synthetase